MFTPWKEDIIPDLLDFKYSDYKVCVAQNVI